MLQDIQVNLMRQSIQTLEQNHYKLCILQDAEYIQILEQLLVRERNRADHAVAESEFIFRGFTQLKQTISNLVAGKIKRCGFYFKKYI